MAAFANDGTPQLGGVGETGRAGKGVDVARRLASEPFDEVPAPELVLAELRVVERRRCETELAQAARLRFGALGEPTVLTARLQPADEISSAERVVHRLGPCRARSRFEESSEARLVQALLAAPALEGLALGEALVAAKALDRRANREGVGARTGTPRGLE